MAKKEARRVNVAIVLEDGMVQAVYADSLTPGLNVEVLDLDGGGEEAERKAEDVENDTKWHHVW